METVVSIIDHAEFLKRLGPSLPRRLGLAHMTGVAKPAQSAVLSFTYRDVPFTGRVERQGSAAVLHLTGAVGPLPFTAEAARRRRRALTTLAATHGTALSWQISATQEITVEGTIALADPLTPVTTVAGAVRLLLRGDRHLALLLDVLGEVDGLNAPQAA